jgi:release factor glutamine methyltransferase
MNTLIYEVAAILGRSGMKGSAAEALRIVQIAQAITPSNYAFSARAMAALRATGIPLAFVIGHQEFMGIELMVDEGALAPREETELLGNTALGVLRSSGVAKPSVVDMCCGSGNLACAIAHHLPAARVWASDLTDGCIAVTRRNVEHIGVGERVVVAQGDLFTGLQPFGLEGSIDAIVCNPPYISQSKLASDSAGLLKHEPREAFDGGPYGISIQQRAVKEALPFLRPGGVLLFEIGLGQERQVKMLFDRMKSYEDIRLVKNTAGEVRVVSGRKRME